MKLLLKLAVNTISVFVAASLVQEVVVENLATALTVAIVLGVLNTFLKPIVVLLTLPINLLTLGLFTFVINLGLIYLASYFVPGFYIGTILSGILFSIILSLINSFLSIIAD